MQIKNTKAIKKTAVNKEKLGVFCIDIIEGVVAHKQLISLNKTEIHQPLLEGKTIEKYGLNKINKYIIWNK